MGWCGQGEPPKGREGLHPIAPVRRRGPATRCSSGCSRRRRSQSCRSSLRNSSCTPVAPVIAPSTSTTRACSRSMLVCALSACDADRMPSRSRVPVLTAARPRGWISDAEVAEIGYTAFTSKKTHPVTALLIVRPGPPPRPTHPG